MRFGNYTVETSREDKVFFPDNGITKGDLINYYREVSGFMLSHIRGRPLSLQRYPDGIEKEGFYQKEASAYFPDWIERVSLEKREEGGKVKQVTCENAATLVYLADQGCVTFHPWLSRKDRPDYPDRMVFDLDPPGEGFQTVIFAARALRKLLLEELKINSYVMTTGKRGLHVTVPLDRKCNFDSVRSFAGRIAEILAERHPERLTTETRKSKRRKRLFLDVARNAYGQTAVSPYSVRPRPEAPVATPLDWKELERPDINPGKYNIGNLFRRLGQKGDPWKGIGRSAISISGAMARLK